MKNTKRIMGSLLLMGAMVNASNDVRHVYGVVLAGGSGERLWPLSRAHYPKQLLAVGTEESLLAQAINRLARFLPKEHIFVSTTTAHRAAIESAVGPLVGGLLLEPGARNTGPALTLCCMKIYAQDPDALIVFVPADPYIPASDTDAFIATLKTMIEYSATNSVITLCGIKPTSPATGYGYIAYAAGEGVVPVVGFKEKPSLALAEKYVESGMMLWNTGVFCATARVFLQETKSCAPGLYDAIESVCENRAPYESVESISIDYAVLEKSSCVAVLPATFSWCDVGNLAVFLSLKASRADEQPVISVQSNNNLVSVSHKRVALVGVDDLCVVETDDVLLICKQSEAEKVRGVVSYLKQHNIHSML